MITTSITSQYLLHSHAHACNSIFITSLYHQLYITNTHALAWMSTPSLLEPHKHLITHMKHFISPRNAFYTHMQYMQFHLHPIFITSLCHHNTSPTVMNLYACQGDHSLHLFNILKLIYNSLFCLTTWHQLIFKLYLSTPSLQHLHLHHTSTHLTTLHSHTLQSQALTTSLNHK